MSLSVTPCASVRLRRVRLSLSVTTPLPGKKDYDSPVHPQLINISGINPGPRLDPINPGPVSFGCGSATPRPPLRRDAVGLRRAATPHLAR